MNIKRYKKKIFFLIILQIIYALLNSGFAFTIKNLTDSLTTMRYEAFKNSILTTIIIVLLLISVLIFLILLKNSISAECMIDIKNNSLKYFYMSNKKEITDDNKSKFYSFLTNQLDVLENSLVKTKIEIISDSILLIISIITIIYFNILFLPLVLLVAVFLGFTPFILKKWISKESQDRIKNYEKYMSKSKNYIDLFYIVKVYNIDNEVLNEFSNLVNSAMNSKRRLDNKIGIANGTISFMNLIITLAIYTLGGYLVFKNTISIGILIAVAQLMANVTFPLTNILSSLNEIYSSKPIKEYYENLLRNKIKSKINNSKNIFPVELKKVSLTSKDKKILKDINLKIEKGKNYLIIGSNGSGKSTLAKILTGIITEYDGEIRCDGENEYNYLNTMYISKDNQLFEDSVENNLSLYGKIKYDIKDLERLNLDEEFLKKSCNQLSDGEKQKLIYIRSLYSEKKLMIYDEPDSSLDDASREILINDIVSNGLTNVVISHYADKIINKFDEIWCIENGNLKILKNSIDYFN